MFHKLAWSDVDEDREGGNEGKLHDFVRMLRRQDPERRLGGAARGVAGSGRGRGSEENRAGGTGLRAVPRASHQAVFLLPFPRH